MENPPKKFFRLSPGQEVRLRYAYFITCRDVIKNAAGEVTELRCTYDPATRGGDAPDGRKVKATLHLRKAVKMLGSRLISVLEEAIGRKAKLDLAPMQPGDVKETFADIRTKLQNDIAELQAEREAAQQRKTFDDHFTHLALHGVLHLLGFDHEKKADARRMETLEIALLARWNIANPYEIPDERRGA